MDYLSHSGYCVYYLICPIDLKVRYIGQTSNLKKRLFHHFSICGNNEPKNIWIRRLKKQGLVPICIKKAVFKTKRMALIYEAGMTFFKYKNQIYNNLIIK